MELATAGPFVTVQNFLDGLDGFLSEVVELEKHRAVPAFKLLMEFPHHLSGPVIALDEALALVVGGIATERAGHIGRSEERRVGKERAARRGERARQSGRGRRGGAGNQPQGT